MKLSKILLLLALLTLGVSCSSKRKKDDASKTADISQEVSAEDADFIVDSEDEDLLLDDGSNGAIEEVAMSESAPLIMEESSGSSMGLIGGQYTVEKGDTLMWIAFKLYGDYRKWQHLSSLNGNISATNLATGMTLNHDSAGFNYNPQGLPHLIKVGETLGTISGEKYGTDKRWKEIWDNNRAMIHDPNIIFAGFTLHYLPDRDIASEDI
ncbi:hypothetical protein BIY24_16040 [Halobacteriovorax marinus]|uniref:Exported protein n=1 Tax=Halobacteriovorax marinus (strain ATCC BAA-682 / DSM 15412 / SJ) TaxID=862908 RepID=E1X165_HALMS|nr:LysM peptidoglycan-binding domain-containing protein [Halobacteriovorax marinus]ATH09395.1 hypothetical protein BIY24_16040 [Halobacteriovorax marinus]CBW28135.1 putative exported protein [Halobacteriovorax marinus SJ]